jgi:hypothetical protein
MTTPPHPTMQTTKMFKDKTYDPFFHDPQNNPSSFFVFVFEIVCRFFNVVFLFRSLIRVTRLDEFSPFGRLFTKGSFFEKM